ncbi:hypothetical protein [Agriterribacter sp.]|uniref:hypothetical protein n=1 Tax=Agriterribacter sp. TaxID=2821509 RepID=UPI002CE1F0CC|nr:hypothetical protein [Agriterribacter sp.]HRP55597.1 hypothetical protein [Agriterribacter sp.]
MANTKAILFLLCLLPVPVIAQQLNKALLFPPYLIPAGYNTNSDRSIFPCKAYCYTGDSTVYYFLFVTGVCKGSYYAKHIVKSQPFAANSDRGISLEIVWPRSVPELHGNVSYDFFYQSAINTPYARNRIMQHSARAAIYTTIGKTLPVTVHINTRQTNSPLFKNHTDAGIEFDRQAWRSGLKEKLKIKMMEPILQDNPDHLLHAGLQKKYALQQQLGQWLQDSRQVQQLMDSRQSVAAIAGYTDIPGYSSETLEKSVKKYLQDTVSRVSEGTDHTQWMRKGAALSDRIKNIVTLKEQRTSSGTATLNNNQQEAIAYLKKYMKKKEEHQQLSAEVRQLEEKYRKTKAAIRQAMDSVHQLVDAANGPDTLQKLVKKYGLDSSKTYRRVKRLMAIEKFFIGRSAVDHSELSAKHISITGVNAEYSGRFYCAVAAGTVDYAYRDLMVNGSRIPGQWLTLVRAGIGKKKGNSLIFTAYRGGRKALGLVNNNSSPVNPVLGITIEGRYYLNKHNYIIAEVAKSSYPQYVLLQNGNDGPAKSSALSDRSNEAYSIQLFAAIPSTGTRVYGQYKYMGPNFQSFTIFNYNAQHSSWQLSADQYFFKSTLFVAASVKNNEYNSPYTIYNYKSNAVLKSIRATLRMKRWPVISAGFMPASQLTKAGNEIMETRFNMIMVTAGYMYRVKQYYMHVSVIYNKFFNNAVQQQFLYHKASTWMLNHSITGQRFTLNTMLALNHDPDYTLLTAEEGIQYSIGKRIAAGGGLKLNRMNRQPAKSGYYGNAQLQFDELGKLSISFDHGFLPGMSQTLLPNDLFRIIYSKTF